MAAIDLRPDTIAQIITAFDRELRLGHVYSITAVNNYWSFDLDNNNNLIVLDQSRILCPLIE